MTTYVVKIQDEATRKRLEDAFEKVGFPRALYRKAIVKTEQSNAKQRISQIKGVEWVHDDDYFLPEGDLVTQEDPQSWFLNRIADEEDTFLARTYGEHADIYVMDTGVRLNHQEFDGRAHSLFSHDSHNFRHNGSAPFHGTAVSSCAAGKSCGVAKGAQIYNLRFNMSFSEAIKAADRLLEHHRNKDPQRISILNMSFGGPRRMLADEIEELTDEGVICLAAAGNEGRKGAMYPARERDAISIGATNRRDRLASFTNYGRTIDLFAPGSQGIMADIARQDAYRRASGTSFACPITAGAIATIVEPGSIQDGIDVRALKKHLLTHAFKGDLTIKRSQRGSPNRLLNVMAPIFTTNV